MKKKLSFVALVSLVVFQSPSPAYAEAAKRYILLGADVHGLKNAAVAEGGVVANDLRYHSGFTAQLSPKAAQKLKAKFGDRLLIEEDGEVKALGARANGRTSPGSVQPAQTIPWGIKAVKSTDAFAVSRGEGVTVCVVDTGVQPDHPDLAENVAGGENFVVMKGTLDSGLWRDDNGHGTHVSGTIAAVDNTIGVVGVAPRARIFAAKVLNKQGSGYNSAIADGIRSCVANGASVINMSLGGPGDSTVLHQAIIDAKNAGLILVAAAGNDGGPIGYPAKYSEVLAVTAVDVDLQFAYFSSFGAETAFAAPGVSVYSTVIGNGYATFSGTSMATPHVAGVAALMISSGSRGLAGTDIGLAADKQGQGLVDALKTVKNR